MGIIVCEEAGTILTERGTTEANEADVKPLMNVSTRMNNNRRFELFRRLYGDVTEHTQLT